MQCALVQGVRWPPEGGEQGAASVEWSQGGDWRERGRWTSLAVALALGRALTRTVSPKPWLLLLRRALGLPIPHLARDLDFAGLGLARQTRTGLRWAGRGPRCRTERLC